MKHLDRRLTVPPFGLKGMFMLALCLLSGPAFAKPQTKLYVEAFATKQGAKTIQQDVTMELRKLDSVSLVANESIADLVLAGGGEIWVRGYRSFSPRSHLKLPTNGTPIYGGFLSVELKNKRGVTVWSYLATPGSASGDISKDLSKQIVKNLAEALPRAEAPTVASPHAQPTIQLSGAGATFPYPVYRKWFTNFQTEAPGTVITYDAIGSEAGVRKLLAGDVDFGASDSPEAIEELAPSDGKNYLLFPSVVGAVVPIVNVPGVPSDIAFTPEALAGIFLGTITKWNDPILVQANHGIHLPDLDIVVVHRSEGSGTSYAWSDYLSKTSPEWKLKVGTSLVPEWPTGRRATGSDGVAAMVKELGGSIGYVEFIYALQNHLSYGRVRNQNGEFVAASLESIAAAVLHSAAVHGDFKTSIVDAPGAGSYPIASFTWLVVHSRIASDEKRNATTSFLRWMLEAGQWQAATLGYLPLPKDLVTEEEDAIAQIH